MHQGNLRLSNTLRAALMLTILALCALALESGLAFVADLARSLRNGLLHMSGSRLSLLPLAFLFLWRISWAFFAASMIAVVANAIHAILRLTTMACTVDPHTDLLFYPRYICFERRGPFARIQGHIVSGEHGADFILLNLCTFSGCHCDLWSNRNRNRLGGHLCLWSSCFGRGGGRWFSLC